jgi:hypothetical protein
LKSAHCFSPNEENKIKRIIYDIGCDKFEECIKDMAGILQEKYNRQNLSPQAKDVPHIYNDDEVTRNTYNISPMQISGHATSRLVNPK